MDPATTAKYNLAMSIEIKKFEELGQRLQKLAEPRMKVMGQYNENELVLKVTRAYVCRAF